MPFQPPPIPRPQFPKGLFDFSSYSTELRISTKIPDIKAFLQVLVSAQGRCHWEKPFSAAHLSVYWPMLARFISLSERAPLE